MNFTQFYKYIYIWIACIHKRVLKGGRDLNSCAYILSLGQPVHNYKVKYCNKLFVDKYQVFFFEKHSFWGDLKSILAQSEEIFNCLNLSQTVEPRKRMVSKKEKVRPVV